ncbi:MAG: alpha-xylosidase [Bacteroidales bacterium]|nr:alpha-xylosidase [Bacteroidales bacterium]MCF8389844.1 alpha-xylosidase [Bacteroidales bacterium]
MKKLHLPFISLILSLFSIQTVELNAQLQDFNLYNEPVDITPDFRDFRNTYYVAEDLVSFDPASGQGVLRYKRHEFVTRMAFNNMMGGLSEVDANEFPSNEYAESPELAFSVEFVSSKTIRLRAKSGFEVKSDQESLMLVNGFAPKDHSWKYSKTEKSHVYTGEFGRVEIDFSPWKVSVFDQTGKLLTSTNSMQDNRGTYTPVVPFSFVRRASDYSRSFSAAFNLMPEEKIFGLGESFTGLNKRGQKVVLWVDDANGTQNETMYKPIPFYMSSGGYGVFMHTSAPISCDFGKYFNGTTSLLIGDEELDLFLFLGNPKDILDEYTNLTGKSPIPPLWSFGFWMSRITYFSEEEGRDVVEKLRKYKIPSDVLHFDTGWFEKDWRCDYQFAGSRFEDPSKMIKDFKKQGIETCLWQLPYFVPKNTLFKEIIEKNLYVKNNKGNLPTEDAVLDFSNPNAVEWYQGKIKGLLDQGVAVIKVDFGEAAPYSGLYASGRTGFYEHNLYPLRYNKAVSDITYEVKGERIIWGRSTWAGSQRYPLHWGGDAANTYSAMSATLRGGLSLGVSGFSFWSHDIGGFVNKAPENIYRHWAPFGMVTSHVRSHGAPPTEPWEYGVDFTNAFRDAVNMRYRLMPYIYAQAHDCSERGLPMLRALFIEFPDDPGSWLIDNQYMFGSEILAAPLFSDDLARNVYLPPGEWVDYQTGKSYSAGWHHIKSGDIPIVLLVKNGAVIPHIALAQSTKFMDWSRIELRVYGEGETKMQALLALPDDGVLRKLVVEKSGNEYTIAENPFGSKIKFEIK